MSKPKHTPGPWHAIQALTEPKDLYQLRAENGSFICQVLNSPHGQNARLIAAAPDCLAALTLVLNDNRLMNAMSREQSRAILDAVAKATGGAA